MADKKVLREIPFFHDLTDEEFEVLAPILKRKVYKAGETLFKENEVGQILYIICKGEVKVCKEGPGGDLQTITLLKDGDICGEMSFLDGRPHSATIVALVETEVYLLRKEDFDKLIPNHPFLIYKLMKNIVFTIHAIVRGMNTRYVEMINYMWGRRR